MSILSGRTSIVLYTITREVETPWWSYHFLVTVSSPSPSLCPGPTTLCKVVTWPIMKVSGCYSLTMSQQIVSSKDGCNNISIPHALLQCDLDTLLTEVEFFSFSPPWLGYMGASRLCPPMKWGRADSLWFLKQVQSLVGFDMVFLKCSLCKGPLLRPSSAELS